jgi:hypothetical protein
MKKIKIKTIDVNVLDWFDKSAGNSYFAGTVTVNYGLKTQKMIIMPFQYGYGDHYQAMALKALIKEGLVTPDRNDSLWGFCESAKIILRCHKRENCKQRELKAVSEYTNF